MLEELLDQIAEAHLNEFETTVVRTDTLVTLIAVALKAAEHDGESADLLRGIKYKQAYGD